MNILYKSPFDQQTKVLNVTEHTTVPLETLFDLIRTKERLTTVNAVDFVIFHNGKVLKDCLDSATCNDAFLHVCLAVKGGKGGFGSMLRAIGAQIEKTTNREACRDLSGRRLRDVNEEKRIKEWIKKQAKQKEEQEKKKIEKLKRLAEMTVPSSCVYNDTEFEKNRAEIPDIVEESINYGLQQQQEKGETSGTKRKSTEPEPSTSNSSGSDETKKVKTGNSKIFKKQTMWLGIDADSDSDSEDEDESSKAVNRS